MATNKPQDDYQKQGVRIPRALHERIHEAAAASGRSYNSELIARLEASFATQASSPAPAIEMLKMSKDQRLSFLATLERSLENPGPPAQLKMLQTLKRAALEEIATIDQQIKSQGG